MANGMKTAASRVLNRVACCGYEICDDCGGLVVSSSEWLGKGKDGRGSFEVHYQCEDCGRGISVIETRIRRKAAPVAISPGALKGKTMESNGRKETIKECKCGSQVVEFAEDEDGRPGWFCVRCGCRRPPEGFSYGKGK